MNIFDPFQIQLLRARAERLDDLTSTFDLRGHRYRRMGSPANVRPHAGTAAAVRNHAGQLASGAREPSAES